MDISNIPEPVLKALYAGYKYHLSLDSTVKVMEEGNPDTPSSMELIIQHYHDWQKYTKEAIVLLEKDD